jgi:hypothetical protein
MSSGTQYDPSAARNIIQASGSSDADRIANLGMSPRQQELNRYFSVYRCAQYEARKVDWDGTQRSDPVELEAIATAGVLPPGFYDAGQSFPLKFRRPTAPYNLVKVIVDRFSGLLFSERHHPKLRVQGDPVSEDYVVELARVARLWPAMIMARVYGGSMGSTCAGFQFINGRPVVEIHDPRWVFPKFSDRNELTLFSIEKKYMYPVEQRDPETGAWVQVPYWYRRTIDGKADIVFKPEQVGDGEEPQWKVQRQVDHNLGFCPVVWSQNLPVQDDIDGDPDCHGIYEISEAIDALLAQANRGVIANVDPTLVIITDARLADVAKGSDNAIKLPAGSTANYLEISGMSAKTALELAEKFREYALEVAQCVLERPGSIQRTATEVERAYAAMLSKCDVLREQYGERLCQPLMRMMLQAVGKVSTPRREGDKIIRSTVTLPPKVDKDGNKTERVLGDPNVALDLAWPHYFEPGVEEVVNATRAAGLAKTTGLIDQEHATAHVAEYFHVEDVPAMVAKIKTEAKEAQNDLAMQSLESMKGGFGGGSGDEGEG